MRAMAGALSGTDSPVGTIADDRYAFLSTFDTIFLIDDSGSMRGQSWRETSQALETIAPICTAYDTDGIEIYFLNARNAYRNVRSTAAVASIFNTVRSNGSTPTGQRLDSILVRYLQCYIASPLETKPLNIIVITDGKASDDVESPIIAAAKKLDRLDAPSWQVGIQFSRLATIRLRESTSESSTTSLLRLLEMMACATLLTQCRSSVIMESA